MVEGFFNPPPIVGLAEVDAVAGSDFLI